MKVIIVGSNGFLGRHLDEHLRREGMDVKGCSSTGGGGIDPRSGLFPDTFSIPQKTDAVVYLAQSPYYREKTINLAHLWNVNVISALKVGELARKANVKRFIYASTGNVYSPKFSPQSEDAPLRRDGWYTLSKIHAEEMLTLMKSALDITILRIFGLYGPGQRNKLIPNLCRFVMANQEVQIERNLQDENDRDGLRISLCYIDDAVRIIERLLTIAGPLALNVAGDRAISIRDAALMMGHFLQKEVRFKILDSAREGDLIADIALLKKVISPHFTTFQHGLSKTIEFTLQNKKS